MLHRLRRRLAKPGGCEELGGRGRWATGRAAGGRWARSQALRL